MNGVTTTGSAVLHSDRVLQHSRRDRIWEAVRREVEIEAGREPMLAGFMHATVLNHVRLEDSLSFILANRLACSTIHPMAVREVIDEALAGDPSIGEAVRADLEGVRMRDPACKGFSVALLYFKGFHALQAHRIAHWLWGQGREGLAMFLQSLVSERCAVDIHPAARIGRGIMFDHATGIVIGETSVVEDHVSFLHEVTLGGTGKETGDRHPKVRRNVMIGAGSKILGNVEIGEGAKIAAGSVVLKNIPPHCTAAGVPARVVGRTCERPADEMDQSLPEGAE